MPVALGLVAATATAAALGLCDADYVEAVRADLNALDLPIDVRGLPGDDAILDAMAHDKKSEGGVPRLILPTGPATVTVVRNASRAAVIAGLDAIRTR